jgi:hypothetical protein
MRVIHLMVTTAALGSAMACGQAEEEFVADATPIPTTVNCADVSQLTEQAADGRRRSTEGTEDRARIIAGGRASFMASLATIAQLKCRASVAEADVKLEEALVAARGAGTTTGQYEAAHRWNEAALLAGDAIALLVGQIPPAVTP